LPSLTNMRPSQRDVAVTAPVGHIGVVVELPG
jgi:hypothetical protein